MAVRREACVISVTAIISRKSAVPAECTDIKTYRRCRTSNNSLCAKPEAMGEAERREVCRRRDGAHPSADTRDKRT